MAELSCRSCLQVGSRGVPLARDQSRAQIGEPRPARDARTLALLLTTPAARPRQFNTRGKAWGRLVWNGRPFATRDGDLTGSGRIRCSRKREWQWLPGSWRQRNAEAAEAAAGAAEAAAPSSVAEATPR